jgi:hypothetical protein
VGRRKKGKANLATIDETIASRLHHAAVKASEEVKDSPQKTPLRAEAGF